jgi:hypothetical protein
MARKFLTPIDLNKLELRNAAIQNLATPPSAPNVGQVYFNTSDSKIKVWTGSAWQNVGGSQEEIEDYIDNLLAAGDGVSLTYDDENNILTIANTGVLSVTGTANEVDVDTSTGDIIISLPATINADTTGNAATASKWATARTVTFAGGDVTGSFSIDGSGDVGDISLTVGADSVALGTDTTGDYVATIGGTDGVSISGAGTEGRLVTVSNTDKGSSQNIFKNISDGSTSVVADSNNDTVTITGGTSISVTADAGSDTLTIDNDGVTSVTGTTNQIDVSDSTGDTTLSFADDVVFPGTVTLHADPTEDLHAATKQYVDNISQGVVWKNAVNLLAASNIGLTGSTGTLTIDGHSTLDSGDDGYRLLLTGQSTDSQNGIYTYTDNGSVYTLVRPDDADVYTELIGTSVFVMEGTLYANTGWIQSNHYLTDFTGQSWSQFSGAGSYTAGNGLHRTGTEFSIDTSITVDVSTEQTLSNKTLTSPTISGLYLADNQIVIEGDPDTSETTLVFTNPTADRTITFKDATGTVAFVSDITNAVDAIDTDDIEEGSTNLYHTDERAQDAVGTIISGSNSLSAVYNDEAPSITFDTTLASTSYMSKTSGLAVDVSALETKLITDGFPKKASANVGNGSATSFTVTHNLATRDVVVNVYDAATFDTVECDVVRTDTNTVTVSFAVAPTSNAYRVVIVG